MLEPETRHLLTDVLRPPDRFSVETALATTYTLDLQSVLLAPFAMAAYDQSQAHELDSATPLALLESIRRHAEHTTVLCQAAGIHVPAAYPKLAAFAEGCVAEVVPTPGRTFHPKLWVLRFVDEVGVRRHRFACLSRNLTGDQSWDTVLVCDEEPEATHSLDAGPLAAYVRELIDVTVRPLSARRREQILDLCETLAGATFALPEPFTSGQVLPFGTPAGGGWPLPGRADTWAVVSPFLDATSIGQLPQSRGRRILVSRPDTLERLGSAACGDVEVRVLQSVADAPPSDLEGELDRAVLGSDLTRGLHAKLFLWESDGQGHVITGSANCTQAAFNGNHELSVLLSGPRKSCGVEALLGDDSSGFLRMTQAHTPSSVEPTPDPVYVAERQIEAWHVLLATCSPQFLVAEAQSGYDVTLKLDFPPDPDGLLAASEARPVGTRSTPWRPVSHTARWANVSLAGLTPYVALRTEVQTDAGPVSRDCVLVCEVVGAPDDRLRRLLRELLARQEDILRYLALLLGEVSLAGLLEQLTKDDTRDEPPTGSGGGGPSFDDLVLLEPLVRAAARGDDALVRAHRLLEDLRDDNGELPQLSQDFIDLWRVVWEGSRA
jgi:hypothetical protein